MSARAALSSRLSPSLLVALLLPSLSFPAFAQLRNKRLSLSHTHMAPRGLSVSRQPSNTCPPRGLNTSHRPIAIIHAWGYGAVRCFIVGGVRLPLFFWPVWRYILITSLGAPCVFHPTPREPTVPGPLAHRCSGWWPCKATSLGCALHPLGLGG
jgi:hypothetical protein